MVLIYLFVAIERRWWGGREREGERETVRGKEGGRERESERDGGREKEREREGSLYYTMSVKQDRVE